MPKGIQILNALAWLNLQTHGREYAELLHNNFKEEVKHLMLRWFRKETVRLQIDYMTEDLKMDPNHKGRTFICLLKRFSEEQLLYLNTRKDKESGCLFSDLRKKQIISNYAFDMPKYDFININNTLYSDFHMYTEAKSAFILAEGIKSSKTNKTSEPKKSKDNISGADNGVDNKERVWVEEKLPAD